MRVNQDKHMLFQNKVNQLINKLIKQQTGIGYNGKSRADCVAFFERQTGIKLNVRFLLKERSSLCLKIIKVIDESLVCESEAIKKHMSHQYKGCFLSKDDLLSEAFFVLRNAFLAYDNEKGRVSTYWGRCLNNLAKSLSSGFEVVTYIDPHSMLDIEDEHSSTEVNDIELALNYFNRLDETSKEVVFLRLGLDGGKPKTYAFIAKKLGVSQKTIRERWFPNAIRKLRCHILSPL